MSGLGKIIWLASYPKSGNTWLRIFFANLLSPSKEPVNINELKISTIASNRSVFDEYSGVSASDLTLEEVERLRPYVYEEISNDSTGPVFFKIHDAFIYTSEGQPLVSLNASHKAIYIIRNPLDVAVSFANHLHTDLEQTVEIMNNPSYRFCKNELSLNNQLEQKLLSWSQHVKSWTEQQEIEVKVIRYEDMLLHPIKTFGDAATYCNVNFTPEKLDITIKNSSFEVLQSQEKKFGFKERPGKALRFFRSGKMESWKTELDEKLVKQITENHREVMEKFGYL